MRTEVYEKLLRELESELRGLELAIFRALKNNPNGLTRSELVALVMNESRAFTFNNDTKDRKIRKAIESMRRKGVPILSTSGKPGYRLDVSEEGKRAMVAELISRRNKLDELIMKIKDTRSIPTELPRA